MTSGQRLRVPNIWVLLLRQAVPDLTVVQGDKLTVPSEQMNERMYVLSIVATVFLPLGFFTGLMGINVGGMPGVVQEGAFWVVVALYVGVTSVLGIVFRHKKWL